MDLEDYFLVWVIPEEICEVKHEVPINLHNQEIWSEDLRGYVSMEYFVVGLKSREGLEKFLPPNRQVSTTFGRET